MDDSLPTAQLSDDVSPRNDLWRWVNERWLLDDPIPADRARYGLSDEKRARVAAELGRLVEDGAGVVGRVHRLVSDRVARDAAGTAPVADELAAIDAVADAAGVLRVWGERQREGVTGPFAVAVVPREDDARHWQLSLFQAGLTLPAPGLYERFGDDLAEHVAAVLAAAGFGAQTAAAAVDLERALADASWQNPYGDSDDDLRHPLPWRDLPRVLGVDLTPYAQGLAVPATALSPDAVWNVCQPSFARALGRLLAQRPVEDWRALLRWRVLDARATVLTTRVEEEHARFHGCVVGGQKEPAPPWRRSVDVVQQALPMDLAHEWVEAHLTDRRRDGTRTLAETLRAELRRTLRDCDWLGPDSTRTAIAKLDSVVLCIGWPDEWDLVGNVEATSACDAVRACARREHDRQLARLAGPVDRSTWGPPPFVVNTFYHPYLNQVTVEGASLPPEDVLDDLPVLLGQYGSIIGHELGHAFDSRGAARDDEGLLRDWWTPDEHRAFAQRVRAVESQVHGYRPRGVDDASVDGRRVGFECVAELIGYQLAWDAYVATASPQVRARAVEGWTGDQRFFLAKAYGRRAADRPRTARNRLDTDVHPPFELFANLARNLDGFHEAFGTQPGDGMWLDPHDRVRIF